MFQLAASILVLLFQTGGPASDDTSIQAKLDEARSAYNERVDKASETLLAAIEKKSDEAADQGDLEALKEIEAQKQEFAEQGTPPTSRRLASAVAAYKVETRAADNVMLKQLKIAMNLHIKAKNIEEAEALSREIEEITLRNSTESTEDRGTTLHAYLTEGTVLKGDFAFIDGKDTLKGEATLTITGRNGKQVKAIYKPEGGQEREFIGEMISPNSIKLFRPNTTQYVTMAGAVRGKNLELAWANYAGRRARVVFRLPW